MKNRTKKWLLVAGCLVICIAITGLIGNSFTRSPVQDASTPAGDADMGGVTVDPNVDTDRDGKDDILPIVVKPDTNIPSDSGAGNGAVFTGTEQTIQPDVTKPEYGEDTLKDPAKTPDSEPVSDPPKPVDHDTVQTPPPSKKPITGGGSGGGNTGGGLPGFDNVPQGGENKVIPADDMYENGNKIGIMG